jgi:hypothetical protein
MVQIAGANGYSCLAASENRGPLRLFELKEPRTIIPVFPNEISATLFWKDGSKTKRELYYGSSFQSQSGRHISVSKQVTKVEITQLSGSKRLVSLE